MSEFPQVSIVITTFRPETKPFLDECIKSVYNLDYPKDRLEVILVGKKSYCPEYDGIKTIHTRDDRHTAEGLNYGINYASKDSKYYLYLNDDVILTKESLTQLIMTVGDGEVLANATSPCDNYLDYALLFMFEKAGNAKIMDRRFYEYADIKDDFEEMRNARSVYPKGIIFRPWLAMYATLIPKICWDKIGPQDENFKTGQCDMDFCFRARQHNIRCVTVLNSLIWHFGGKTSQHTLTDPLRVQNIEYFRQKWGQLPDGITEEELLRIKVRAETAKLQNAIDRISIIGSGEKAYTQDFTNEVMGIVRGI